MKVSFSFSSSYGPLCDVAYSSHFVTNVAYVYTNRLFRFVCFLVSWVRFSSAVLHAGHLEGQMDVVDPSTICIF